MGNGFVNSREKKVIPFSNSVTHPLYCGLLIEGSALSVTEWEKRLMTWIAEKNQNLVGLGLVGVDVCNLAWTESEFDLQKKFLLKIISLTLMKKSWNKYGFQLIDEIGLRKIGELREMIHELSFDQVNTQGLTFYYEPPSLNKLELCEEHQVYLNYFPVELKNRCLICSSANF